VVSGNVMTFHLAGAGCTDTQTNDLLAT